MSWLIRLLLIAAASVTGWFVAKDAPNFGVVEGMVALLLVVLAVFVLAFWPGRWTRRIDGSKHQD